MPESDLSHLDERGAMRMVSVGQKPPTDRKAVAEGFLVVGPAVMEALREGKTPKGDVFAAARLGGIAAAKKTSELIPLCHSIPLSHVSVDLEPLADRVRVTASASAQASTGVEMEALAAVSVAALTLYDMLKAVSHEMTITGVRLLQKTGGKSDFRPCAVASPSGPRPGGEPGVWEDHSPRGEPPFPIRAAVLTVSDRCSTGAATDTAGPAVADMLADRLGATIEWHGIVSDEADQISSRLKELATQGLHVIVTVGGTGCAPRDVTPEATRAVITREVPGLSEAMRAKSTQYTPHAILQRGVSGICDSSLIVNLPGSERAATQNLEAILPVLHHAVALARHASRV
jgi:cyclic pyranopterin phosphate synthase